MGMKGQEIAAGDLSPEISPVWVIERDSPEWQFLKGVRLVRAAGNNSIVAGQFGRYEVVNPADSGMIATVRIDFSSSADLRWDVRLIQSALANFADILEAGPIDTRWDIGSGQTISPIIASRETNAAGIAGGFLVAAVRQLAQTTDFVGPVVLAPGSTLFWSATTVAVGTSSNIEWAERPIPRLEL